MMKKRIVNYVVVILAAILLASCTPRVLTDITMSYPARSVEEVKVYDVGDTVPNSAVAIGKVAVLDRGLTTNCGYDRMLGLAKERTAENGGNGLLLTEHRKPSFWGSSCHQLMGTMFLIDDTTIDPTKPNAAMEGVRLAAEEAERQLREHLLPANSLRLNVGPSWITSDVETFRGNRHPTGWEVTVDYEHRWRSGFGVGANFAMFHSSYSMADDGVDGSLSLFYIGPSLVYASRLGKHWGLGWNLGLGYARADDVFIKQSGVGFLLKARVEYLLNDQWGLGLDLSNISSTFKKPEGVELRKNERWGFNRISLLLGLRCYF